MNYALRPQMFTATIIRLSSPSGRAEPPPRTARMPPMDVQGRPRASEFVFARLRYDSGDWDYNPKVAANVLNSLVEYTTIRVYPEEVVIPASSEDLLSFPFLFMTGHKLVRFSVKERERLKAFVAHGG